MKSDNTNWNRLLLQIADLMEKIQNHRSAITSNINPDILETLDGLEEAVAFLQKMNRGSHEVTRTDPDKLKEELYDSPTVSQSNKEALQQADVIAKDGRRLQIALAKTMKKKSGKKMNKSGANAKGIVKERKKMFKPLGGDTNWIPM
jgi:hypothetical protein